MCIRVVRDFRAKCQSHWYSVNLAHWSRYDIFWICILYRINRKINSKKAESSECRIIKPFAQTGVWIKYVVLLERYDYYSTKCSPSNFFIVTVLDFHGFRKLDHFGICAYVVYCWLANVRICQHIVKICWKIMGSLITKFVFISIMRSNQTISEI